MKFILLSLLFLLVFAPSQATANELQQAIDNATDGAIIVLEDGVYEGPITIWKNIALKGEGENVKIKGDGKGSVIDIIANGAEVENIKIMGSGESHESIDSCITVKKADNVKIIGNRMDDCLFGVNFELSNNGVIENNTVTSKNFSLGLKGDGIRLWYSHSNKIKNNTLSLVRDMVFWYSSANKIENNTVSDSRYSLHFMYADRNFVANNTFKNNSVGIFFMYSHNSVVKGNTISGSSGAFGIGIGFKEVSDCVVEDNTLLYNARGFYLDQSPYQPGTLNTFKGNRIQYNTVGIQLHGVIFGSLFENNILKGNIDSVSNDIPSTNLTANKWNKNYWDEYVGFDRDKDGYGDVAYEHIVFADKIMNYIPAVKFFYGAPVMSVMNFIAKLLPFSDPEILASDPMPRTMAEVDDGR